MKQTKKFLISAMTVVLLFALLFTSCGMGDGESTTADTASLDTDSADTDSADKSGKFEDGKPYAFKYVSNGDGTCYIDGVEIDMEYTENFSLDIPDVSPDGDKVVGVNDLGITPAMLPTMLTVEDYNELKAILEENLEHFYCMKVQSYYILKDIDAMSSEKSKAAMLEAWPITELTDVYVFDQNASHDEMLMVAKYIRDTGKYHAKDLIEDYEHLCAIVDSCTSENKAVILETLPTISETFATYITEINFPKDIQNVDLSLYRSLYYVEEVVLPDCVKEIPEQAFSGLRLLKKVVLNDGVEIIKESAFFDCGIIEITIPDSVTTIENSAFQLCGDLREINFGGTVEQWNAIEKGQDWNFACNEYTVHCSDGDVIK